MPEFFYDLLKVGEVMKYDSQEYKYFSKAKGLLSEPGYWAPTISMSFIPMWNPKLVKKDITKYTDLLDPQFKAMIVSGDPMKSESYLTYYMGLRKVSIKASCRSSPKQDIVWFTARRCDHQSGYRGETGGLHGKQRTAYVAAMEGADIKVLFQRRNPGFIKIPLSS